MLIRSERLPRAPSGIPARVAGPGGFSPRFRQRRRVRRAPGALGMKFRRHVPRPVEVGAWFKARARKDDPLVKQQVSEIRQALKNLAIFLTDRKSTRLNS